MSLADDLLTHAEQLARLDPTRPRQVSLRRSASASYYALFHMLTEAAAGVFARDDGMVSRLSRAYNHGEMRRVAELFVGDKLPKSLRPPTSYITPADLKLVAARFLELQQVRHEADYGRGRTFTRGEACALAQKVRLAFEAWERVRRADDARLFLACLLLWDRWDKDPR